MTDRRHNRARRAAQHPEPFRVVTVQGAEDRSDVAVDILVALLDERAARERG